VAATSVSGPAPQTIGFNGTPSGGTGTYVEFLWTFGDGGSGSGPALRYTFLHNGSFQVVLRVTDSSGTVGTGSVWVNLSDPARPVTPSASTGWGGTIVADWPYPVAGFLALLGLVVLTRSRGRHAPPDDGSSGLGPADGRTASPEPRVGGSPMFSGRQGPPGPVGAGDPPTLADPGPVASVPIETRAGDRAPPRRTKDVSDQLIARLGRLGALSREDVATIERTQRGLAEELGIGLNVVSRVLSRLVAAEVVEVQTRHVAGQSKRMKAYELTPSGARMAQELRRREYRDARKTASDPDGTDGGGPSSGGGDPEVEE